jgi:anti-repressor protein
MSGLEMFSNGEFELDIQPHPVDKFRIGGTEVAKFLGYRNASDLARSIPEGEKGYASVRTPGGDQRVLYLTLPGFLRAMGQRHASRVTNEEKRAQVIRFQDWVFGDVVPTVLTTGGYSVPQQRQSSEVVLPTARDLALMVIEAEDAKASLAAQVAVLEPAAALWNEVATAEGSVLVGDAAKMLQNAGIDTGPLKLFKQMEALGWVYRWSSPDDEAHSAWRAKQDQITCGRLVEVPTTFFNRKAEVRQVGDPQIRVTMKGVEKLHDLMGRKRLALPAK